MIEWINSKQKLLVFEVSLILGMTVGALTSPVLADVPSIENIESWISGNDTFLNITARHASPTSSHYVNTVEVDVDGSIQNMNLSPQSTVTFIVQYNMGEISDTPTISTRAHCTFHGWSSWSEPLVIPEFPIVFLFLALAVLPIIAYLLRSKVPRSPKKSY